ncbi:MAG: hypothetical protein C4341_09380 [Armatimonadota bacterium]
MLLLPALLALCIPEASAPALITCSSPLSLWESAGERVVVYDRAKRRAVEPGDRIGLGSYLPPNCHVADLLEAGIEPVYDRSKRWAVEPGDRIGLGSYLPLNCDVADLLEAGVVFFHAQTDELGPPDGGTGKFAPELLQFQKESVERLGAAWGLAVHTLFPSFDESLLVGEGTMRLDTGERVPAWSPWDVDRTRWSATKFGWVNRRFPNLNHVVLGVFGEYGDASFFTGLAAQDAAQAALWRSKLRVDPPGVGYWSGDPKARASWQAALIRSHGTIEKAYADWGMEVPDPPSVPYPITPAYPYAARAEYIDWYRSAIPALAGRLAGVAREIFLGARIFVPVGPPHDMPELGFDAFSLFSAVRGNADGVVTTNLGYYDFAANWALSLGRIRAAARATDMPLLASSPAPGNETDANQRLFEVISLGARAFVEWPQSLRQPDNPVASNRSALRWFPPQCDVAVLYPSTAQGFRAGQPAPRLLYRGLVELRDYADCDVLEESAVVAGALSRYRVAVLYEGTVWSEPALRALRDWVLAGGVVVAYDFGKMATPSGDTAVYQELFGFAQTLAQAAPTERWVGELPDAYRVTLGSGLDTELLLGTWGSAQRPGRVAYSGAQLRLPVRTKGDVIVAIRFSPYQTASGGMAISSGDREVASVSLSGGLRRFQFTAGEQLVQRGVLELEISLDADRFVTIESVEVRPADAPSTEVGTLSGRFEAPVSLSDVQGWSQRTGRGLAVFFPGKRQLWKQYTSVVRHLIYRLSQVEPGRRDAPLLDDRADGMYVTYAGDLVAALNAGSDRAELRLGENRVGVVPPGKCVLFFLGQPEHRVVAQAEDSPSATGLGIQASPFGTPSDRPNMVRVDAGEEFSISLDVPAEGKYRLFLRTVRSGALYPVECSVGDSVVVPPPLIDAPEAFTYRVGEFTLPAGEVHLRVRGEREFLFDFAVLTDEANVVGFRRARDPSELARGLTSSSVPWSG